MIVATQAAATFAQMGMTTHAVGILASHGVGTTSAIWRLSAFSAGGLFAQAATGILVDRFDTPRVIVPFAIAALSGVILLQSSGYENAAMLAIILVGIGCGGQTNITSYFITRYFGVRNFSSIYGTLLPVLLLCAAPAPALVGAIVDATGSYGWALALMSALLTVALLLFAMMAPYPYPARERDIVPPPPPTCLLG